LVARHFSFLCLFIGSARTNVHNLVRAP
jgi:hypothetical protein